ncbi:hypothetical protein [Altererythrobacter sp. MF3-039]|uniref:hypothetical protein n=1 Tax=Altererythrobacter sp. MF3-039 TaxID=3252901 RepID=UPI00390C552D
MNSLMFADDEKHKPVRAGVMAACLAVAACFGAALALSSSPAEAGEVAPSPVMQDQS